MKASFSKCAGSYEPRTAASLLSGLGSMLWGQALAGACGRQLHRAALNVFHFIQRKEPPPAAPRSHRQSCPSGRCHYGTFHSIALQPSSPTAGFVLQLQHSIAVEGNTSDIALIPRSPQDVPSIYSNCRCTGRPSASAAMPSSPSRLFCTAISFLINWLNIRSLHSAVAMGWARSGAGRCLLPRCLGTGRLRW
jgi:hypothetical protein